MVLLYPTSNTRAHSFFVMLNLHILEQNKSVVIFTLISTIYLSVSISFDWCDFIHHSGVQGETPAVFSSVGGNVTLPCSNVVYPDCFSTTWAISSSGVELFINGEIRPDVATHRAKRLSLGSDCSLHITDVTTEDAGRYTCLQYLREGGPRYGKDAYVYLSVLQGRCYCCCFQALRGSVTEVKWICWIYLVCIVRYSSVFNSLLFKVLYVTYS